MKVILGVAEAEAYVQKKGGSISLKVVSEQVIEVGYKMKIPVLGNKTIKIEIRVENVKDRVVYLRYEGGVMQELAVRNAIPLLKQMASMKNFVDAIELGDGNSLQIHLDKIEQLTKAFEYIELEKIYFEGHNICLDLGLKG